MADRLTTLAGVQSPGNPNQTKHMIDQDTIYSLRLSPELTARIDQACEATSLKKVDVIRLSIERGIDLLVAQLTTPPTVEGAP